MAWDRHKNAMGVNTKHMLNTILSYSHYHCLNVFPPKISKLNGRFTQISHVLVHFMISNHVK